MRVLITGITGFAGSHLAELCLKKGFEVFGTIRWRSRRENIKNFADKLNLLETDLRDPSSVSSTLRQVKPNYIFHLAAQSFVPTSWNSPSETFITNVFGQLNIFEAMRELKLDCPIQLACSSEEYGLVYPNEIPIKETNPLRPLSPYAVSKVAQDYLGYQYFKSYGLKAIRTRAFNHTGPRRGHVFVTSNFAKQIAEIENNQKPPVVKVGNLEPKRDFTDVRDVVRAYVLAAEKGQPGEVYNIASGRSVTIKEILNMLLSLSDKEIGVEADPKRLRPSDVENLCGDSSKFTKETGWLPEIPLEDTLRDLLNWWRSRV